MRRWRKQPNEKGLAKIGQPKRGAELREDGVVIASVLPTDGLFYSGKDGWYWYGFGQNTWKNPCATIQEAKDQVMDYIKKNKL